MQAGRPQPTPLCYRTLPAAHRLADLVRRYVQSKPLSLDAAPDREIAPQRSADPQPARGESLSRNAAPVHPGDALSVPFRGARQSTRAVVGSGDDGGLDSAPLRRRSPVEEIPGGLRVDRRRSDPLTVAAGAAEGRAPGVGSVDRDGPAGEG